MKNCHNAKTFVKFVNFLLFVWDFLGPKCFDISRSKFSIPLDQMHRFFVSNICNGNIPALWDRKSCLKSWYSSKSLRILSVFLVWFFGPKMFWYYQIIYYSSLPANLKRNYFQATMASIIVYGTKSCTLTKSLEKAIGGAYSRMLIAVMNISWKQHPTKKSVLWQHSTSLSNN